MADLADNVRAYLEEVRLATIATTNRDGSPHQTALWYLLRGETVLMNTASTSKKVRNLRRDPRAAVAVIDHAAARHVTLLGTVSFDEDHVLEDLTSLATRYAGPQAGPRIAESIARVPHISLLLEIEQVQTFGKL